jgi:deoxyribonuclease-1-like protein
MRKPLYLIILAALAYGGFHVSKNFQIDGLDKISLRPRGQTYEASYPGGPQSNVPIRAAGTIRIASYNIQVFGKTKLAKPQVAQTIVDIIRKFDVVAIQEIRDADQSFMSQFIDMLNSGGRHYDYVIGPRLGRTDSKEQYAFVFDAQTIEVDRGALYTVDDRDDIFHREPFVASFRVRGPPPDQAFTFTLVDIHTDPDEAESEVTALAQVYRAVRNDGRGEDDIIILGDLNADEKKFNALRQIPNMAWTVSGVPTNTHGTKTYDNILYNRAATIEFTGRSGVFDTMREYNLTEKQALEVSDHCPIWAEFSAFEGGTPGRVATRPEAVPVR